MKTKSTAYDDGFHKTPSIKELSFYYIYQEIEVINVNK